MELLGSRQALLQAFSELARNCGALLGRPRRELLGTCAVLLGPCMELRDIRLDLHGIRMALLGTRPGLLGIRAELIGVAW